MCTGSWKNIMKICKQAYIGEEWRVVEFYREVSLVNVESV